MGNADVLVEYLDLTIDVGRTGHLVCYFPWGFGALEGENFSMLYPEPQVALQIAEVAGYQAKVVYQDRNRHALLKLRRDVGDANEILDSHDFTLKEGEI